MAHYRLVELDLSTRVLLALEMLQPIPERRQSRVTELAQTYAISRAFLYDLRDRALEVLTEGLLPRKPGPRPQDTSLVIDRTFIQRAIMVMLILRGAIRDIQRGLRLLFGVQRSVGYISQTLTAASEQSKACNLGISVPLPILDEADGIFQGRKPCLTPVDRRSFLVVDLTPAASRDGTSWGVTYLDLVERGIQFHDLAVMAARGSELAYMRQGWQFPCVQTCSTLSKMPSASRGDQKGVAHKAIETAERARQADLETRGILRRRGRRLKIKLPLPQTEMEQAKAIERFDQWSQLLSEVCLARGPITPVHAMVSVAETKATVEMAMGLLKELNHPHIAAFVDDLQEKMPQLLAPLEWLEQQLTSVLDGQDADTETFILWAWQHRHALNLSIDTDFPETLCYVVHDVWNTLELFHRSSSLTESLHSWLRPYLQIHRGIPGWLFPLLQLFWNHHQFERGKRARSNPLQLAEVANASALEEVWHQLFCPRATAHTA